MYTNATTPLETTTRLHSSLWEVDYRKNSNSTVRTLTGNRHWALFKYITAMSGMTLSDQEKSLVADHLNFKKLRKRQYFLQEGDVCKYMGFILRGSTRMFSINERGQESILAFGLENLWVADLDSFKTSDFSSFYIEALEDTDMLIMNLPQLENLVDLVPAVAKMYQHYQLQQLILAQRRINAILSMTAEERYYDLLKSYPEFARRFSQNMLACYLGMKPETLSRIRKR